MPAAYPTDQATMAGMFFMRFTMCGRDPCVNQGWRLGPQEGDAEMFFAIPIDEPVLDDVPRHRARQRLLPPRDPRRLVARGRRRRRDDTAPSGAAPRALRRLHRRRRHLHAVDAPPHRARPRARLGAVGQVKRV